jgi:hypothetical protein
VLNPDGYVYNQQTNPNGGGFWRKNRRDNGDGSFGVDLNRNYGYQWGYDNIGSDPTPSSETYRGTAPFSEPEIQAIRNFCESHNFYLALNYHAHGELLIYPWGYIPNFLTPDAPIFTDLAIDMTQFNNYQYGTGNQTVGYVVNGDSDDWMYGEQTTKNKIFAMTPEVGTSFWPSQSQIYPIAQENVYPNLVLAWGPGVILADSLDPNPPENVTAYSDYSTPNSIQLTWDDPTAFASGDTLLNNEFTIEIERDGSFISSVAGGILQYVDMGLNDGQSYTYDLYAKIISTDSVSETQSATWTSGGAATPESPTGLYITESGNDLLLHWTNPLANIDGTPLDDFDGINLYEDNVLVTSFSRTGADTGSADSALYSPPVGTHQYYVTAYDNETPVNESGTSNTAYSPISIPFYDDFPVSGVPNPGYWLNNECEVNSDGDTPPSTPYVLNLDGDPSGGGDATLLPVDLSSLSGSGIVLAYWWQPEGLGDTPEAGDDAFVDFLNDQGTWVEVRHYVGSPNQPFQQEVIDIASENAGSGATFFHAAFQFRFRNTGTSGPYDDWNFDNVFLGLPTADPQMTVMPLSIGDTLLAGDSSMHSITVGNQSPLPSSLGYSVVESPTVTWLSVTPVSGTLTSGQSELLEVRLDGGAVSSGTYNTELIISGNDPANAADTVSVELVVNEAPLIRVEPDTIEMAIDAGSSDSTTFTIYNDGQGPLQVLSIEDEEVSRKRGMSYVQAQRPYVSYGKGEEPVSQGGEMVDGSGGPDPFGYKWIDSDEPGGPTYEFTDISGSGTALTLLPTGTYDPKDEGMATVSLPWGVKFYGNSYTQLQVNTNGFITFDLSFFANAFTNAGIPNVSDPNLLVCAFWEDLDGSVLNGEIYTQELGNKYIIQWTHWSHFSGTEDMTFQIVLFKSSSTIWFVYESIDDQSSTTYGIENVDGTVGLEIAFDQSYAHNGLLTKITLGAEWLTEEPTNGTVAAGDSLEIKVKADGSLVSEGNYAARVLIESNDPLNGTIASPVVLLQVGEGAPAIGVSPTTLDFDTVNVGADSTLSFTVENVGYDTLVVSDIVVTDGAFSVDTTSFMLLPSGTQEVEVKFSPTTPGSYSGLVKLLSNDPSQDTVDVSVSGYGEPAVGIEDPLGLPTVYGVSPNYPNPFNPATTIKYQLPQSSEVRLSIYNVLGQKVRTLVNSRIEAGYHSVEWDGRNEAGTQVASGIYIYRFQADNFLKIRKMILMK